MRLLTLTSLFLLIAVSCDSPVKVNESLSLEEIYLHSSEMEFEQYLNEWNDKYKPIPNDEQNYLTDTLRNVYKIYQEFYDPLDLRKYCTTGRCPEFGVDFYDGLEYIIVQNEIRYTFNEYEDHKTISFFFPKVDVDAKVLYLTNEYEEELNAFLDRDVHEDIQARYEFINTKIRVVPGHWFGWHFLTHPEVSMIYMNTEMDSAKVNFRIIYEGGEAVLQKSGNQWNMIESKLTWIE